MLTHRTRQTEKRDAVWLLLGLVLSCVMLTSLGCGQHVQTKKPLPNNISGDAANASRKTRDFFKLRVHKGMTKEQVRAALGRPTYTNEMTARDVWSYKPVYDTESQSVGADAKVIFSKDGHVEELTF